MKRLLVLSTLLSVLALSFSSLNGNNRYGASHSRNSLNYRGGSRYSAPHHGHGPSVPSAPHSPRLPHSPSVPHSPRLPHAPRGPASHSYGAQRNGGYGTRHVPVHQPAPVPYGGGRHYNPSDSGVNQYHGPVPYAAGPVPYGGGQVHGSSGSSHYSSAKRSVYQQPQEHQQSYSSTSRSGYPHQQNYAQSQQHAQSTARTHGREMKYTIRDPQNRGTTHVTETHVVSNKQMHGAEAEAAMKKLMGSMGPGSDGGFNDFVKGMGLPFY